MSERETLAESTPTSLPPAPDEEVTAPLLEVYLAERDEPCPACGYNLRGLTSDRCPECGQALRLTVTLVDPKLGAWLVALVAAALGTGGALLFTLLALAAAPWGWWSEPSSRLLLVMLVTSTVSGVLLFVGRRAYQRRAAWLQRLVALGVCAMVALLGGIIIAVF